MSQTKINFPRSGRLPAGQNLNITVNKGGVLNIFLGQKIKQVTDSFNRFGSQLQSGLMYPVLNWGRNLFGMPPMGNPMMPGMPPGMMPELLPPAARVPRVGGGAPPAVLPPPRDEIAINALTPARLRDSINGGNNPAFPVINGGNMVAALDRLVAQFNLPNPLPDALNLPAWLNHPGFNRERRQRMCQYLLDTSNAVVTAMTGAGHARVNEARGLRDRLAVMLGRQVA